MASGYIEDCASFIDKLDNANRQLDDAVTTLTRLSEKHPARMVGDREYVASAILMLGEVMKRIEAKIPNLQAAE
jgi:hypothetical protein